MIKHFQQPANLLMSNNHQLVLTDFGSISRARVIVKSRVQAMQLQEYLEAHSTPAYRAPEFFDIPSDCVLDERTDVWVRKYIHSTLSDMFKLLLQCDLLLFFKKNFLQHILSSHWVASYTSWHLASLPLRVPSRSEVAVFHLPFEAVALNSQMRIRMSCHAFPTLHLLIRSFTLIFCKFLFHSPSPAVRCAVNCDVTLTYYRLHQLTWTDILMDLQV
jgi:serine/threonine protein kinase